MSETDRVTITAALAWVELDGAAQLIRGPEISFDRTTGIIDAIEPGGTSCDRALVYDLGRALLIPGMINAHSHAFQRAIRGATHR
ncbi:MAG TPA: hypothetical protein VK034_12765, partial [Enhygromyxa sp.]|nr:hypothetical protein [Enhygromyxa sp.]